MASSRLLSHSEISKLSSIPESEIRRYAAIQPIRISSYYSQLIDWSDASDPLRQIVFPSEGELTQGGDADPSNERSYTRIPGLQHKYGPTALLLTSDHCSSYCRYCFRKRLFWPGNDEVPSVSGPIEEYLRGHEEVRDVILSGGDPLLLATTHLSELLKTLCEIPSIETIRIHSKGLAFDPQRITGDEDLLRALGECSQSRTLVWGAHFDHPRELTVQALEGIATLAQLGIKVYNQCPLLRGVNDDAAILRELFISLAREGCSPYYLFQCRPVVSASHFSVPILEGVKILNAALRGCTGLERRVRYVMSHSTGKIEIVGASNMMVILRRLSSPDGLPTEQSIGLYRASCDAKWLNELLPLELN